LPCCCENCAQQGTASATAPTKNKNGVSLAGCKQTSTGKPNHAKAERAESSADTPAHLHVEGCDMGLVGQCVSGQALHAVLVRKGGGGRPCLQAAAAMQHTLNTSTDDQQPSHLPNISSRSNDLLRWTATKQHAQ
jgi:hypothetical protein